MIRLFAFLMLALACRAAERPNIVFILADDLGYGELGCYGQQKIRTPNLDRLAQQGMRFTAHYSGAPVCAPARCTLLTGRHTGHAQIRGNKQMKAGPGRPEEVGQQPITEDAVTIAEVLKQAGYATGAMGKWGLGPVASTGAPHRQGFDLFFGYNCQAVAHSFYPPYLWRNDALVPMNAKPVPGGKKQPEGEVRMQDYMAEKYAPEAMLEEALQFIRQKKDGPFFLYLPFIEPHVSLQPPVRLVESYPVEWDTRPYRGQCGYLPHPRPRAAYAAMITSLDEHVGAVLKTLEEQGLTKKTLIVFTSDNGTTHGSPNDPEFGIGGVDAAFFNSTAGLRERKGSLHEGGLRVPCIIRWPGKVKPGSTTDVPSYFPDHFPTLCAAAGVNPPAGLDGASLVPVLTEGRTSVERKPMTWVYPEYGGQVAVRFGPHKVIRKDLAGKNPGPWEVYDVEKDREETKDLAAEHPELIQKAKDWLKAEAEENANFPLKWE